MAAPVTRSTERKSVLEDRVIGQAYDSLAVGKLGDLATVKLIYPAFGLDGVFTCGPCKNYKREVDSFSIFSFFMCRIAQWILRDYLDEDKRILLEVEQVKSNMTDY